jgi:copper chaperone CopZ
VATVYSVPDISCQHCVNAITEQVSQVAGVEKVSVDLATKTVTVSGAGNDAAVRAAIDEAGYAAV